ncbi:damage-inducible protein DinB [bacterium]|nr:damage-inducible protein DinB [bacterium]
MPSYVDQLLVEYDREMANTRKVLACIPADKLTWRASPRTNTIGWVANHIAEIPGWLPKIFQQSAWDFAPPDGEPYQFPDYQTVGALLEFFDGNVQTGRAAIASLDENTLSDSWSLLQAGQVFMSHPRFLVVRNFVQNHLIHHRAALLVYLRLNEIPVPGMYGPADDMPLEP